MTTLNDQALQLKTAALFQLGFRACFMAAALFAVMGMAIWMIQLIFAQQVIPYPLSPSGWHAHEMIYGYGLLVVAGFLLTAIRNWTGIQTLCGIPLQVLLLLWIMARVAPFVSIEQGMIAGALCDALFILMLSVAITIPIVQARAWKHMGVVAMVYGFLPGHLLFSLDQWGLFPDGQRIGLYSAFYLMLGLLLLISRRVMPMFIERGIGGAIRVQNYRWVDRCALPLLLLYVISDLFFHLPLLTACLATLLFVLLAVRLWGWYHHGIWAKPLLWVLYLAYIWIVFGFGLKGMVITGLVEPFIALHALAVGGMGMMTMGMMSRISLGHTGRDIMQPPSGLVLMFMLLLMAASVRVLFPLFFTGYELLWVGLSQGLWIAAFLLFLYHYAAILKRPRIDGKPG